MGIRPVKTCPTDTHAYADHEVIRILMYKKTNEIFLKTDKLME